MLTYKHSFKCADTVTKGSRSDRLFFFFLHFCFLSVFSVIHSSIYILYITF